jgi:hypothetical protein
MKKIGILFGMEDTFPQAFIDRVNSKNVKANIYGRRNGKSKVNIYISLLFAFDGQIVLLF